MQIFCKICLKFFLFPSFHLHLRCVRRNSKEETAWYGLLQIATCQTRSAAEVAEVPSPSLAGQRWSMGISTTTTSEQESCSAGNGQWCEVLSMTDWLAAGTRPPVCTMHTKQCRPDQGALTVWKKWDKSARWHSHELWTELLQTRECLPSQSVTRATLFVCFPKLSHCCWSRLLFTVGQNGKEKEGTTTKTKAHYSSASTHYDQNI